MAKSISGHSMPKRGLGPPSTTSICCGFVGQQVVQTVQQLDMSRCCGFVPGLRLSMCTCTTCCRFALHFRFLVNLLYSHDLLRPSICHHSVCSVTTAQYSHSSQTWRLKRVSSLFITRTSQAEHTVDHCHKISAFRHGQSLLSLTTLAQYPVERDETYTRTANTQQIEQSGVLGRRWRRV